MFFGISIREFTFGHDALEDAVGAIATIHVLLQVGCADIERVARPQEAAWLSISLVDGCGAAEKARSKVGFDGINVEGRGLVARRVWGGDGAAV